MIHSKQYEFINKYYIYGNLNFKGLSFWFKAFPLFFLIPTTAMSIAGAFFMVSMCFTGLRSLHLSEATVERRAAFCQVMSNINYSWKTGLEQVPSCRRAKAGVSKVPDINLWGLMGLFEGLINAHLLNYFYYYFLFCTYREGGGFNVHT